MSERGSIVQETCAYLTQQGLDARPAWPGQERGVLTAPAVCVGVKSYIAAPGGFENYLGERYDEETAAWQEFYGKRAEVVLSLDLYAPERGDGEQLQTLLEQVVQALTLGGPEGLQVGEITCGEIKWDAAQRRLRQEVCARCTAWLQAACTEGAEFLDFELRGGWKI